jgi:hypothetical protein
MASETDPIPLPLPMCEVCGQHKARTRLEDGTLACYGCEEEERGDPEYSRRFNRAVRRHD